MPGQRKRKRKAAGRAAVDPGSAGRWEVVFETQDEADWRAYVRRVRAGREVDLSMLRLDTLCGRSVQPTTYRLSRFVPCDDHP